MDLTQRRREATKFTLKIIHHRDTEDTEKTQRINLKIAVGCWLKSVSYKIIVLFRRLADPRLTIPSFISIIANEYKSL